MLFILLVKHENAIGSLNKEKELHLLSIIYHDSYNSRHGRGFNKESRWLAVHPRGLTRRNDFYVVELFSSSYPLKELIMAKTFLTAFVPNNIQWKFNEEFHHRCKKYRPICDVNTQINAVNAGASVFDPRYGVSRGNWLYCQ